MNKTFYQVSLLEFICDQDISILFKPRSSPFFSATTQAVHVLTWGFTSGGVTCSRSP